MRVIQGEVKKDIPLDYLPGWKMMLPEDFEQPKRIRLTP